MTAKNNKISCSQLCVILLAVFGSMRPIIENSIQAQMVGNDCIITCILAGIINLSLAMLICYVMNKNPGKSFYDIMKNFIGEKLTKLIIFLLGVVFIFKLLLIDYQMAFLLHDAIYADINWILFTIPVFCIFAFLSIKGIKTIARCYQIVLPFALLTFIVVLYLSFGNADFENLLPFFDHTFGDIMKSLGNLLMQSCSYIFLLTIMENVVSKDKHYFAKILITFFLVFVLVVTFYVLFVAVLGKLAPFVQESLIKMTQFKDNSYGYFKIDVFITVFWIPLIVLQSAMCVYSISYCMEKSVNIPKTITSLITVTLLFITKFIPQINSNAVSKLFYQQIGVFVLAFVLLLPVLLVIASFKKEQVKNE